MNRPKLLCVLWVAIFAFCLGETLEKKYSTKVEAKEPPPLSIAREGSVFAGGKYSKIKDRDVMSGQLYAEYQIPSKQTHPYPIVMIHGGGQTGVNFMGTPDGREGWAQYFLREGYAVYVMDQPGRGRAAYVPEYYGASDRPAQPPDERFAASERFNHWPQAHLHNQWPGNATPGDPVYDQFFASQVPSMRDFPLMQKLNRDAIIALLEKIGPAILLAHSESGAFGWPVADARPNLVKAILAIEPNGPPFYNIENVGGPEWFRDGKTISRPWGLSWVPLTYSPPAENGSDLEIVRQDKPDGPDLARCWLQKEPAKQLPNLQKIPVLVLTSEASYHTPYDHCTAKYLEQAGVHATFIRLADIGIHGNGHQMMLEKNNLEIAAVIAKWVNKTVPGSSAKK